MHSTRAGRRQASVSLHRGARLGSVCYRVSSFTDGDNIMLVATRVLDVTSSVAIAHTLARSLARSSTRSRACSTALLCDVACKLRGGAHLFR